LYFISIKKKKKTSVTKLLPKKVNKDINQGGCWLENLNWFLRGLSSSFSYQL